MALTVAEKDLKKRELFLEGNILKGVLTVCVPMAAFQLLNELFRVFDLAITARINPESVAAVSFFNQLNNSVTAVGTGLSIGAGILIAGFYGAADYENVKKTVNTTFFLAVGGALLLAISLILSGKWVLRLANTPEELVEIGWNYYRVIMVNLVFVFFNNVYVAIEKARGNGGRILGVNLLMAAAKFTLSGVFVLIFRQGVVMIAFSTLLSNLLVTLIGIYSLRDPKDVFGISLEYIRMDRLFIKKLFGISLPVMAEKFAFSTGKVVVNSVGVDYGTQTVGALGVSNSISALSTVPAGSIGDGGASIIRQNIGSGKKDRALKVFKSVFLVDVAWGTLGFLLTWIFLNPILSVFSGGDAVFAQLIRQIFLLEMLSNIFLAVHAAIMALLYAFGYTKLSFGINFARLFIFRLPILFALNGDFTRQMNYGDCHDRYSSHPVCVYYKVAAEYRNGHAQKLGNMVVKEFLAQEAANSKVKPGILPEAIFEFLWYDPSVEEREFDDLPLARYFEDLGLLALRSSWQRDARVFSIKCGAPGGAKQWREGWKILQDEGIDLFSLSHHHPDNLSYIFASGGEYFTCEDGYNRNLMPDNHNVLLVDGRYTDAQDVNDVYMTSVEQRQKEEGKDFSPESYGGFVSCVKVEGNLAVYRGETAGVYPRHMQMQEVSRVLVTDGLGFWLFADIFNSQKSHIYSVICNTDPLPCPQEKGYRYPMETGDIRYQVFSSAPTETRQYEQQVVSVMTTQEQDKLCRTCIHTLSTDSQTPQTSQVFFECFTFAGSEAKVCCQQGMLHLEWNGNVYKLTVGEYDAGVGRSPVRLRVTRDGAETAEYSL